MVYLLKGGNYLELFCLGDVLNFSCYLFIIYLFMLVRTHGYLFYTFCYNSVILYFLAQIFPVLSIGKSLISCSMFLAGFKMYTYFANYRESKKFLISLTYIWIYYIYQLYSIKLNNVYGVIIIFYIMLTFALIIY